MKKLLVMFQSPQHYRKYRTLQKVVILFEIVLDDAYSVSVSPLYLVRCDGEMMLTVNKRSFDLLGKKPAEKVSNSTEGVAEVHRYSLSASSLQVKSCHAKPARLNERVVMLN